MIPWVTTGNFLKGLILYNEDKKNKNDASLIHVNTIDNNLETFKFLYHEMVGQSKRTKNLMHISLNFHESDKEQLTQEFLIEVAQDFLFRFGFPLDQPHIIYEHKDKGHPHIHIAVPMTLTSGGQINNSFTAKRMIKIAREIEKKYGLHKVNEIEELKTGETTKTEFTESKKAIETMMDRILKEKPVSLEEMQRISQSLNFYYNGEKAELGYELTKPKKNVPAKRGVYAAKNKSRPSDQTGITYFLKNALNQQLSKGEKGSKLYGNLTFNRIAEKFEHNKKLKEVRLEKVKKIVMSYVDSISEISLEQFKIGAEALGVKVHEYYTKTGDVFGMNFEDLFSGLKFKGSDLHNSLKWKSLKMKVNVSKVDTFMVTKMDRTDIPSETPKPNTMTWKEEFEKLKREVSLIQLVEDHGYVFDKKSSTSTALEFKGPDKIGIYNHSSSGDYSGLYYSTRGNPSDKGDIVNFLINKGIVANNAEALKYLRSPGRTTSINISKEQAVPKFKEQKPFNPINSKTVDSHDYLIVDRGIELDIVDKNFNGAIFTTTHEKLYEDLKFLYGNGVHQYLNKDIKPRSNYTVFPMYQIKDNKLVGQQIRNEGFDHLVVNSDKTNGVWHNYDPQKPKIAIFENPIDAVSHMTLFPSNDTSYFGTVGNPSKVIITEINELAKKHETILAGDNDAPGQYFNTLFICNKIASENGFTMTPSYDKESYKISIEGTDKQLEEFNKLFQKLSKENASLDINIISTNGKNTFIIGRKLVSTFGELEANKMNTKSLFTLNQNLIYFYNLNLKTIQSERKDFNEDLMSKPKQAERKRNTPKL